LSSLQAHYLAEVGECQGDFEDKGMATNSPTGDRHRKGAVRDRSQFQRHDGRFQKRDTTSGYFMSVKDDGKPFKGVRKE